MAIYPCAQHGGRYRGPQQTAYPAVLNGSLVLREHRRLCPDCMDGLVDTVLDHMTPAELQPPTTACAWCGADEAPYAAFVTLYRTGREREDYYARVCPDCLKDRVSLALFGTQRALPDTSDGL